MTTLPPQLPHNWDDYVIEAFTLCKNHRPEEISVRLAFVLIKHLWEQTADLASIRHLMNEIENGDSGIDWRNNPSARAKLLLILKGMTVAFETGQVPNDVSSELQSPQLPHNWDDYVIEAFTLCKNHSPEKISAKMADALIEHMMKCARIPDTNNYALPCHLMKEYLDIKRSPSGINVTNDPPKLLSILKNMTAEFRVWLDS